MLKLQTYRKIVVTQIKKWGNYRKAFCPSDTFKYLKSKCCLSSANNLIWSQIGQHFVSTRFKVKCIFLFYSQTWLLVVQKGIILFQIYTYLINMAYRDNCNCLQCFRSSKLFKIKSTPLVLFFNVDLQQSPEMVVFTKYLTLPLVT